MNVSPVFTVLIVYPGLHPLQRLIKHWKFLQVQMTNLVWQLLLNHVNKTKTAVQVCQNAGFGGSVSISDDVFQVCWQSLWLVNISEDNWWDGYSLGFRGGEFSIFLELFFFFWSGVAEHMGVIGLSSAHWGTVAWKSILFTSTDITLRRLSVR